MVSLEERICSLCAAPGPFYPFYPGASLRECRCPDCGSSRRTRDLARALIQELISDGNSVSPEKNLALKEEGLSKEGTADRENGASRQEQYLSAVLPLLEPLSIYELQAQGALHAILHRLPGYVCSEFLEAVEPGKRNSLGVLCQDASRLTFADGLFDAVISQDVLAHMDDPWRGFEEIQSVLKPGGVHIFTVPLHEGRKTRRRAARDTAGSLMHLLPPVFHKDPLNPQGALVFWDYGEDLPDLLRAKGISAHLAVHARFYEEHEICDVSDESTYERCRKVCAEGKHASFFLYNAAVYVAGKA